jgi:hypothetical protein
MMAIKMKARCLPTRQSMVNILPWILLEPTGPLFHKLLAVRANTITFFWATIHQGVLYPSFYSGIDLKVYGQGAHVKYDFIVSPGADPGQIGFRYEGGDVQYLDNGDLVIKSHIVTIVEKKPVAWQYINGVRMKISCDFLIRGNVVSFQFAEGYDPCYELVIDPLLIFSTYSGSEADNWGSTATPGENGTLYSAGVTNHFIGNNVFSGNFPATAGAFQTTYGGLFDIGILKYDSAGTQLLYATYLGGFRTESAHSLVVNSQNDLVLLGTTGSENFPTTPGAFDQSFNGGLSTTPIGGISYPFGSDIVVVRIREDGSAMLGSTFVGGSANDGLNSEEGGLVRNYGDELRGDVITDEAGNIYLSSVTSSADFPIHSAFQTTYQGGDTDAALVKLNPSLTAIEWGAFVGGTGTDASYSIKFDHAGNILIAGGTTSADFPVTDGTYQTVYAGSTDGWIAKIEADGSSILNATYTGTTSFDQIYFMDLNSDEEVYVYGQTSGNFPVTPAGVYNNPNSGQFVQKLSSDLSTLVFSTVFGSGKGIPDISPTAFLVNDCKNLFMTGWGGAINQDGWADNTAGMPVTSDAFQSETSGSDFYFMVLKDDATQFLYGTYMGGSQSQTHVDGGTSRFDKSGVVYHAVCSGCNSDGLGAKSDFPTTENAWSRQNNSLNCNNAAFKFDLSSLKAVIRTNSIHLDQPGIKFVCLPDTMVFENFSIGGEVFSWNFGDGTGLTVDNTEPIAHFFPEPDRYRVSLQAFDAGTCQVMDFTSVEVDIFEKNMRVQDDDIVCEDYPYQLAASGGIKYEWWEMGGAFTSDEQRPPIAPHDTTTYGVKITDINGCVIEDTVIINLIPRVNPAYEVFRESDCEGRPTVMFTNLTDSLWATDRFMFDYGDGTQAGDAELNHDYEEDGMYTTKMTAVREFCMYEKIKPLALFTLKFPNIITPGDPGLNDNLVVQFGQEATVTPRDYNFKTSLTVYDRWGVVVYENDDYQYDWSGDNLASGTYYYEATVEEHATCKTWLQIVR